VRAILLTVLGVALLTPHFADAQRHGRGRGSSWGVGFGDGGIGGYYSNGGWGRGGWGVGFGDGWGRGFDGWGRGYYGWGYPSYGWGDGYYGGYYSTPYYSNDYPSYGYMDNSNMSGNTIYQAGYNSGMGMNPNVVRLDIVVPDPQTEITIQGQRMNVTGPMTSFVSPPLEKGKTYTYTITKRGGQTNSAEETRNVTVQPGGTYTVDFSRPKNERLPAPGGFDPNMPRRDNDVNRDNYDTNRNNNNSTNRDINPPHNNSNPPRTDNPQPK
jgi:uncharacterized protein (TIGR03000 family)